MLTGFIVLGLVGLSVLVIGGTITTAVIIQTSNFNKEFRQDTPSYSIRMKGCPFDPLLMSSCLDYLVDTWHAEKGHSKEAIKARLDSLIVEFFPGTIEDDGEEKRYIVDSFGRKIAGDHSNNNIRVIVLSNDKLETTAFIHECCHELHELENIIDADHLDQKVWGKEGVVSKVKKLVSLHKV